MENIPNPDAAGNPQSQPAHLAVGEIDRNAMMLGTADACVVALVKAQMAATEKPGQWNQQSSVAAICRLVACLFAVPRDNENIIRLFTLLSTHGLGANEAQLSQWLEKPEQAVLPPKVAKSKQIATALLK